MENPSVLANVLENLHLVTASNKQVVADTDGHGSVALADDKAEVEGTENITFNPPVYLQRYGVVQKVLTQLLADPVHQDAVNGRTVMEVGCAEFGMHTFLRNILQLGKIIYLDIDETLLTDRKSNLKPFLAEYLQKPSRPKPLVVEAYAGDITCIDVRIAQENPAVWGVIAIELIEHLYPDVLRGFELTVFGEINPEVVVVTTPNSDFNTVFNLQPGKFRHWDHKFEWSRNEFKLWCDKVCLEFPEYVYSAHGIAEGPPETQDLGCVSQMAIFTKHCSGRRANNVVIPKEDAYKLIESVVYPNHIETRSLEEIIVDDVDYLMVHCWLTKRNIEYCMENNMTELTYSMKEVKAMLPTKTKAVLSADENFIKETLLKANKYVITDIIGLPSIRVQVPLWDQQEQDFSEDDGFMCDYDESQIGLEPQNSSINSIDTDDSWE